MNRIIYKGKSKPIKRICEILNNGGGGSNVSITDLLQTGIKIATVTVNGVKYPILSPGGGGASPLFIDAEGHIAIDYDLLEGRSGG